MGDILASRPCGSCPYRRDAPSGLWDASEYERLPGFDAPTGEQPPGVFMCHQQDGRLCAGWVACHDMEESLGLRMASVIGLLTPGEVEQVRAYTTDVPVFASGAEAAEHGLAEVHAPGARAVREAARLTRRATRRTNVT